MATSVLHDLVRAERHPVDSPDVAYLDDALLAEDGRLRLLPAAAYATIPQIDLLVWCYQQARYCLPTVELVDWLQERIAGRSCLEICAGNGDLGYHLGIPAVDNFHQQRPEVTARLARKGWAATRPTSEVIRMDAMDAVRYFRPAVVVGSWVVPRNESLDGEGPIEEDIILNVESYIHIGHWVTHKNKSALTLPHKCWLAEDLTYASPDGTRRTWLISRMLIPELTAVWQWGG